MFLIPECFQFNMIFDRAKKRLIKQTHPPNPAVPLTIGTLRPNLIYWNAVLKHYKLLVILNILQTSQEHNFNNFLFIYFYSITIFGKKLISFKITVVVLVCKFILKYPEFKPD